MADQKITLHPKDSLGQIVEDTNVYPKTTIDQVYTSDGSSPFDFDFQRPLTTNNELSLSQNNLSINFASNAFKSAMLDMLYPVGAIYTSTTKGAGDKCPIELTLGGRWERIKDRFLLAAGDTYTAGNSAGNSSVTLQVDNMPSHTHSVNITGSTSSTSKTLTGNFTTREVTNGTFTRFPETASGIFSIADFGQNDKKLTGASSDGKMYLVSIDATHTHNVSISGTSGATGSGSSFSIMPPYLVVYVWKRIADNA